MDPLLALGAVLATSLLFYLTFALLFPERLS
jgi:K+-transporting ATPase KdpF subunit